MRSAATAHAASSLSQCSSAAGAREQRTKTAQGGSSSRSPCCCTVCCDVRWMLRSAAAASDAVSQPRQRAASSVRSAAPKTCHSTVPPCSSRWALTAPQRSSPQTASPGAQPRMAMPCCSSVPGGSWESTSAGSRHATPAGSTLRSREAAAGGHCWTVAAASSASAPSTHTPVRSRGSPSCTTCDAIVATKALLDDETRLISFLMPSVMETVVTAGLRK
mmetsp:Transcript_36895/g.121687  ORF Transcript_36895/g.121687 Transcript_36895/m.121687 type:complete len:219 (+) Transcript_36895:341-997(+)